MQPHDPEAELRRIGRKIKKLRADKGITQDELARKIGVVPSTIDNYEAGIRNPKIKGHLKKIADVLGTTEEELEKGLSAGIHPRIAQEFLGHADASTTEEIYSHVLPGLKRYVMEEINNITGKLLQFRCNSAGNGGDRSGTPVPSEHLQSEESQCLEGTGGTCEDI